MAYISPSKKKSFRRSYGGVFIAPIFTHPSHCGANCIFCPTTKGIPKSYIPNNATLLARQVAFSPSLQFEFIKKRFKSSILPLPFEVIILGGSFSFLENSYRSNFMEELYSCMQNNGFESAENLENATYRPSILTVESRPDQITDNECQQLRALGVSKVEIGVQHTDSHVLRTCNRGHDINTIRIATNLLKKNGFKVGYHVMLGLPGSTPLLDDLMLSESLWSDGFMPDFLKIYPCVILKDRTYQPLLHKLHDKGAWVPPTEKYICERLKRIIEFIPNTVRISRVQRYFPEDQVAGGFVRGLRESDLGKCSCIRCREAGVSAPTKQLNDLEGIHLRTTKRYNDTFVEVISNDDCLLALARLYDINNCLAILRELHVYGQATPIGEEGPIQGRGLGTRLLKEVEEIVRKSGKELLQVNAAYGAKPFFRKNGYIDLDNYLLGKYLNQQTHSTLT